MSQTKKIRLELTEAQFMDLWRVSFDNQDLQELHSLLDQKLDRIVEHDLYTQYKTAPTEAQREEARKQYIEAKGIHPSFRW